MSTEKTIEDYFRSMKPECIVNKDDDTLPFAYHNPETEGKLTWHCGEDAEGKITSVFVYDFGVNKEKKCAYLENIEKAKEMRDTLVDNGWLKLKPPKMEFTYPDDKGNDVPLNRKQRRYLARKINKINKNPFE